MNHFGHGEVQRHIEVWRTGIEQVHVGVKEDESEHDSSHWIESEIDCELGYAYISALLVRDLNVRGHSRGAPKYIYYPADLLCMLCEYDCVLCVLVAMLVLRESFITLGWS